ncbi:ABC transporter substrate binding protein [Chitinimonas sp.]|uniref:ABC transporter substrate binding protein n=1 Tax=Chitinimonas sp. TaxID=1934313 RepID=UPI0035B2EE24
MISRRHLLGSSLALGCLPLWAAPQPKRRIVMLLYRGVTAAERGFMDYLRLRMPVEFIIRDAGSDHSRIAIMVAEARMMRPDLIYTFGTNVTLETVGTFEQRDPQRHIADIPVVFNIVADPIGASLAPDTRSSLRNLTGVSHLAPPHAQWQTLRRYGKVEKLAIIYSPNEKNAVLAAARFAAQAKNEQVQVRAEGITCDSDGKPTEQGLRSTLNYLLSSKPDWLYLPSDSFLIAHAGEVVERLLPAGIPVFSATEEPVRDGGALAGLVSPYYAAGQFAGYKAEQILLGRKKASEVSIDTLARFSYLINITTARQLHRYPPLELLRFAETVEARNS